MPVQTAQRIEIFAWAVLQIAAHALLCLSWVAYRRIVGYDANVQSDNI
jgi:hypothetical protein